MAKPTNAPTLGAVPLRNGSGDREWYGGVMSICLCLKCGQKIDERADKCPYCETPRREDAKYFQELLARLAKGRKQPYHAGHPKA